jgi:hypothetical protein
MAVSVDGELGKYHRVGQHCDSSACGAVLAAYQACKAGEVDPNVMDMSDMQQTWLRQRVHACYPEIAASREPLQTLITKTYHEIERTMLEMVNHDFGNGKLILLGGIQVRTRTHPHTPPSLSRTITLPHVPRHLRLTSKVVFPEIHVLFSYFVCSSISYLR